MCKFIIVYVEVKCDNLWFLWSQKCDIPRLLAKLPIGCKVIYFSFEVVFEWPGFYVLEAGKDRLLHMVSGLPAGAKSL